MQSERTAPATAANYPVSIARINHVAPVPRRIRAFAGSEAIVDTQRALYVWEWAHYPQFYLPAADVRTDRFEPDGASEETPQGTVVPHALVVGGERRAKAARLVTASPVARLAGTWRFEWDAFDRWFEEDEEVFVHPRNPYSRVDAVRSTRTVRVELESVVLAESSSPVMVFETGLPTRYYLNRSEVRFEHLVPSPTVTRCPYKGTTTGYWSARTGGTSVADIAWTYAFATPALAPIAGLIAFYNERVDTFIDGAAVPRPATHVH